MQCCLALVKRFASSICEETYPNHTGIGKDIFAVGGKLVMTLPARNGARNKTATEPGSAARVSANTAPSCVRAGLTQERPEVQVGAGAPCGSPVPTAAGVWPAHLLNHHDAQRPKRFTSGFQANVSTSVVCTKRRGNKKTHSTQI